ncbi:beta-propeller domain-containing protein [Candidatus Parcubacteria bacterium]|nr:beta-propeller domain-containing protein [Candidatus Parcubacteria bacterium]
MKDDFKLDPDRYYNINDSKKQKDLSKPKTKDFSLLFIALFLFIFIGLGGALLVSKINNGATNPFFPSKPPIKEENDGAVKKFKDYTELKEFLEEGSSAISGMSSYMGGALSFESRGEIMDFEGSNTGIQAWGSAEAPASAPIKGMGGDDYSTTNIQVGGVDEGDIIKTDGKYIYTVTGNEIVIIDAYPADNAKELSRIKLDSRPSGIYINGGKLAVYGQNYNIYTAEEYKNILPSRRNNYTFLKVYDTSDKSNPVLKRSFDFEGSLVNSRMIGDYIYSVTSSYNYYYDDEFPVPAVIENGKVLSSDKSTANYYSPDIYYFDIPYHSYNFTTVSALNINDDSEKISSEVYLLDGQQNNMFVSQSNIYVTFNKQVSEMELAMEVIREMIVLRLDKKDQERIAEIQAVKNYILSPEEKLMKIGLIFQRFSESLTKEEQKSLEKELEEKMKQKYEDISKELEKTVIHKIEINDGKLKYKTSGEVTGRVLNQFSMDENGGYFRIATTKNRSWSRFGDENTKESYSNLYVLDENMKVVGEVEGLAKGEKIYSVRFMQNRAYMVTFKQVDPLFVIDLKKPTDPKVMGELKVPGYSSYLHPYDETTLIGLGKETSDRGIVIGGIKLSLFDVSDISDPKEIDKYVLGDRSSNSIAINEHKAFLFSKEKNLLVIPVSMREDVVEIQKGITPEENIKIMPPIKKRYFNGAAVFKVDKNGFELQGKVDHSNKDNSYRWNNGVQRSLYIEDILYTLSNKYLKMNNLSDVKEVNSLELREDDDTDLMPKPTPVPMPEPIF